MIYRDIADIWLRVDVFFGQCPRITNLEDMPKCGDVEVANTRICISYLVRRAYRATVYERCLYSGTACLATSPQRFDILPSIGH